MDVEVAAGAPIAEQDTGPAPSIDDAVATVLARRGETADRAPPAEPEGVTADVSGGDGGGDEPDAEDEGEAAAGNEPDDGKRSEREDSRQKYKRQRDEARHETEQLRQRDAHYRDHAAKMEGAYSKVQEDYEVLQADFEEIAEYAKGLEKTLSEYGWEADPTQDRVRELSRENRRLKLSQERDKRGIEQRSTQEREAAIGGEAQRIADETRAVAKKHGVEVSEIAKAAATILASGQMPDVEEIAKVLAVHSTKARSAREQRERSTSAPRTMRSGHRPSRPAAASVDGITEDATRMMREKFEREGRVFPRR